MEGGPDGASGNAWQSVPPSKRLRSDSPLNPLQEGTSHVPDVMETNSINNNTQPSSSTDLPNIKLLVTDDNFSIRKVIGLFNTTMRTLSKDIKNNHVHPRQGYHFINFLRSTKTAAQNCQHTESGRHPPPRHPTRNCAQTNHVHHTPRAALPRA